MAASEPSPPLVLTPEQQAAVARRQGELLLSAAAGSGKTAVLVERFVRAVLDDGVAPARILAITFTDRAAGELRARLRRRLLELGARDSARDLETAFVGTFHSFCARMLRLEPLAAGVPSDFVTLDDTQASRLRALAYRAALGDTVGGNPAAVDLLAAYDPGRLAGLVLGVYAELRSQGQEHPRLPDTAGREDDAQALAVCDLLDRLLGAFGERYTALKLARAALDFDDLELRAGALVAGHPAIAAGWRDRLQLLMVDEVQDVNRRQSDLLEALQSDNLFLVGDGAQAIYGFRHADVRLFEARRARLSQAGRSLALTHNFRALPPLIDAVNAVFSERWGDRHTRLVAARSADDDAASDAGPLVELLVSEAARGQASRAGAADDPLAGASPARVDEARLLAARVADLIASGSAHAGEVVVLLRARTGLEVYAQALAERGVPTQAVGSFWQQQAVCDLMAYLRALANPLDEVALYGVLASPLVGLSSDALGLIARAAQSAGTGAWQAALALAGVGGGHGEPASADAVAGVDESAGVDEFAWALADADRQALAGFCRWLFGERVAVAWHGVAEALRRVIDHTGYERLASDLDDEGRALANIRKLVRIARRFQAQEGSELRTFLIYAQDATERALRPEPPAPVADEYGEAVRLMTIHAAKGLQFEVVCVPELGAAHRSEEPYLLVDGARLGLRLARLGEPETEPVLDYDEIAAEHRQADEAEEDRLLYVALTRARNRLLLSAAVNFKSWPEVKEGCAAINWLAPALVPDIAARAQRLAEAGDVPPVDEVVSGPGGQISLRLRSVSQATPPPVAATVATTAAGAGQAGGSHDHDVPGADPAHAMAPTHKDVPGSGLGLDPEPAEPLEDITYTSLTALQDCGYRYYLERVLRLPERPGGGRTEDGTGRTGAAEPAQQLRGDLRGTIVHRLLEQLDFSADRPVDGERVGAVATELDATVPAGERERIAQMVQNARVTPLGARLASTALRRELSFAFAVGPSDTLVTGRLDAVSDEPGGGCLVVDYKSDRVGAGEDLDVLVGQRYGAQRLIYALAALRAGYTEVEVVHWFLERPLEPVGARFVAAEASALEARLDGQIERIRERPYAVSDAPHERLCSGCPGRGTLCSWSFADTVGQGAGTAPTP
jgi:ATP-dependent exoDNAse (exonuclease V) beta subunit